MQLKASKVYDVKQITYQDAFFILGIYSPNAYRGFTREFIKNLESIRLVHSSVTSLKWVSIVITVADQIVLSQNDSEVGAMEMLC